MGTVKSATCLEPDRTLGERESSDIGMCLFERKPQPAPTLVLLEAVEMRGRLSIRPARPLTRSVLIEPYR
jgi:hypothetical protein